MVNAFQSPRYLAEDAGIDQVLHSRKYSRSHISIVEVRVDDLAAIGQVPRQPGVQRT